MSETFPLVKFCCLLGLLRFVSLSLIASHTLLLCKESALFGQFVVIDISREGELLATCSPHYDANSDLGHITEEGKQRVRGVNSEMEIDLQRKKFNCHSTGGHSITATTHLSV